MVSCMFQVSKITGYKKERIEIESIYLQLDSSNSKKRKVVF